MNRLYSMLAILAVISMLLAKLFSDLALAGNISALTGSS
jgi:hypothetical protein